MLIDSGFNDEDFLVKLKWTSKTLETVKRAIAPNLDEPGPKSENQQLP